ncbi:heteromeric transposase endonuclease subunit TnsA [Rhodoferax saidenbachensis]|uniref:Heteromeric transposase endonuclease subunit TnsA n=1 Tax=Rhodoferax saidenbachensis TaxID=1484693 RepID=A0A1P8K5T7_9BURK|nr:heteromeric transposase endonuclease subunit TnsA [Rhodoferax saidenbachensis]APW41380.1 heteromeric transposase endonuclease subunit TnsA [Rhodoferax saidenbachensis]
MPVRKIPKNYLLVTGGYSSRKNADMGAFESLLEKDYLLLLDFDDSVETFEVQPVRIPVAGIPRGYVPDVLVKYRVDTQTGVTPKPSLVEVKHSDDFARNAEKYVPKFAAARQYAEQQGWEFVTKDQNDIRTPRLANLKFLREYRNVTPSGDDVQAVLDAIGEEGGEATSEALLDILAVTEEERLHWLPIVWSMVLTCHLGADLDTPFQNDVPLWKTGASA